MAILRDQLFPTVSSQVQATPKVRRNSMLQPALGQDDSSKIVATPPADPSQLVDPNQQQQFLDQPVTGDYIAAGLQRMAQRQAPPALDPGSRVKVADTTMTTPDNFQSFYDMLGSITQRGQEQLGAAQAISAANRLKAAQAIAGQMGGGASSGGGGSAGQPYSGPVGKGVQQWAGVTQQAMKMLGIPDSYLNAILRRMNQESGGNPNAINNWDSNAKAGHPSQGLMQTIPGTFNAYAGSLKGNGIYDPLANIYAGLNYAGSRYGPSHGGFLGGVLYAMNKSGGY